MKLKSLLMGAAAAVALAPAAFAEGEDRWVLQEKYAGLATRRD